MSGFFFLISTVGSIAAGVSLERTSQTIAVSCAFSMLAFVLCELRDINDSLRVKR